MAENKGGSDLDVFEGLAKKKPAPEGVKPGAPTLPGPIPSQRGPVLPPPSRQKTLLGMASPLPPPTPSQRPSALPPPAPPGRPSAIPSKLPSAPPPPAARASMPAPPPPRMSAPPPVPSGPPPASTAAPAPSPGPAQAELRESPAEPSIPAATPSSIAAPVDMDWDDDDEKTTIFDKGDALSSLAPLPAAGAPASRTLIGHPTTTPAPVSAPPPAAPAVSTPPPAAGARATLPAVTAPTEAPASPSITPPSAMMPPPAKPKTGLFIGAAIAAAALLGIGVFALAQPNEGKIAVFVAGSGGRALDEVSVHVNGTKQCDSTPCRVELPKGIHEIRAIAPGYTPVSQGVTVIAGQEQAVNISLSPASAGTGVRVAGPSSVILSIDGKEIGPLPQEVKDLSPGQHTLVFKGGANYADEEKTVNVVEDQIQDLGNVELKLVKGFASFDVKTPGASLTLVSGNDRQPVSDLSKPVEIDLSKNWRLEATKAGFDDFSTELSFDGKAEKSFVVELTEKARAATPAATPAATTRPAPAAKAPAPKPTPAAAPSGNCTLNINSIPVSNVVLNGRPLGSTPKLGISVSAGSHTVLFIHPELGRRTARTSCKAGETKTVAIRLNK